jgi:hypothetical protein
VRTVSFEEAETLIRDRRIVDAKTAFGIQMAQTRLAEQERSQV